MSDPAQTIDEHAPPELFIPWSIERFRHQRIVITTSFGMEGCALIDLYDRFGAAPTVVYLDTGFLFPETYALRDRMVERYPRIRFENHRTSLTPEAQDAVHGTELWKRDPDLCCSIRKAEPLRQVLADTDIWITAITRSQGITRRGTPLVAWDRQFGVLKVCPLAAWNRAQVWDYVRRHGVPYNELHERGYPSIGCTHCTSPVSDSAPHEYSRAGRWAGTGKTECGIHGGAPAYSGPDRRRRLRGLADGRG